MNRSQRLMSLFESLLETEKRLDQVITQKKMAVEEAHFKKIKKLCTVRIHIFLERTTEDTLFVLIGGKVRSEPDEAAEEEAPETKSIGTIINKLFVELNRGEESSKEITNSAISMEVSHDAYSAVNRNRVELSHSENEAFFEWHNRSPPSDVSEFEIKTTAKSTHGRIYISFMSYTGVYELCTELAQHIGIIRGSKSSILLGIWKYITAQKMRDPSKQKSIICNDVFKKAFGQEEITFSEIIQKLDQYLSPVEMINFDFAIPTQPGTKTQLAYDIKTELDPMNREYAYSNNNKIAIQNKKIEDILIRIEKQDEKIESLDKFIQSPKEYISNWILDSSKDLHLIADDLFDISDGFYTQKEIQESVYQLLQNYK
ncbi:SWI/SNF-related matrix-associated actin-dependent regulator of chromatin subfamily D [Nematocida minor]|uniref:SWI/SNF-related matrix-associated actin-dependent regulator of chromatin subfamily D n=1 Tax=Nematocida minor TaxID=1912983 RepID=UPI00221EB966|nr:SWI/SNF-related matrix-associated actin-dependent regulator of chromatin subfamily D [Nematocida minor]KAI5190009.1 SWI/SNF-related matrix-associated actin-dependent regulator of chromatin subfamily D [Nematocida minor]